MPRGSLCRAAGRQQPLPGLHVHVQDVVGRQGRQDVDRGRNRARETLLNLAMQAMRFEQKVISVIHGSKAAIRQPRKNNSEGYIAHHSEYPAKIAQYDAANLDRCARKGRKHQKKSLTL